MHLQRVLRIGHVPAAVVILIGGAIAFGFVRSKDDPVLNFVATASAFRLRPIEGRLSEPIDYRPYGQEPTPPLIRERAIALQSRWSASRSTKDGRLAAVAHLLAGDRERAFSIFSKTFGHGATPADLRNLIQRCGDAGLLIDFSAAALERRGDGRSLLLAYEAADRAWRLSHAAGAAWNRAVAMDRMGMSASAAKTWQEAFVRESALGWRREASGRRQAAAARAGGPPERSLEMFFYRQMMTADASDDVVNGDYLASDTAKWLARMGHKAGWERLQAALTIYARGRDLFERNEYEAARRAYAAAEKELEALHAPLALIARDQRIRSGCSEAMSGCLESMRAFRREVAASGRYRWLAARAAYGEGQTLYRQGRLYEAEGNLQVALAEFETLGDQTSVGFMHVLLANVFAAAGESDLAMQHFLEGIACRPASIGDRRRKMLEDAAMFMLRHGYIAAAELLLDEMTISPSTDATNVTEWMLRGIIAFRRGDVAAAARCFARAHQLLAAVKDESAREDAQFRLAIAEAGSRMPTANPIIAELNAGIAAHQRAEFSVWLPQLLSERGAAYERANDPQRAEDDYRRAIDLLESREPRVDETVLALGVTAEGESPFDRLIRLLLRQDRIAGALSIAQRSNALRISSLHALGAGLRGDPFRQHVAGDGVAELRARLQTDEVAVAYHLLRNELITWVISSREIVAMRKPVKAEDLVRQTGRLFECGCSSCPEAVVSVSVTLLRGWIERVPRGATLMIQPPAELDAVPFSMLTTVKSERLITRNAVTTAPSLHAFARASLNDADRRRAISAFFAAAPLPGGDLVPLPLSVSETMHASRAYKHSLVETHATRARFLERSPMYSIIHFAGHVVVNPSHPLFSALAFDDGGLLYMHELDARSFANARMVVLSGCESGRTPRPTMSVANALLSQGVPSVVYTIVPVTDEAAETFAIAFHRAVAAGEGRASAVRHAQLSTMARWPNDPGSWAAFALAGTPGSLEDKKGEDL